MQRGKGMKFVGDSRVSATNRMPNIPKDYSEYPGKTEAFWPNFLLKEWLVGAVFLIGYLCLTIAHPSPLERLADPANSSGYIPLPDWYFLFLYQLLKYKFVSGNFVILGTVVIPGLAFGALMLAPWLDRGPERRPSKRPIATGLMLLGVASVIYLTWESVDQHDWEAGKAAGARVEVAEIDQEAEGYQVYSGQSCIGCHGNQLEGGAAGPTLVGTGLSADEIKEIIINGTAGGMPPGMFEGTDEELDILAGYIENDGFDPES